VSVCPRAHLPIKHARSLPIFVHVAYRRGSVFLRRDDTIPRGGTILFFPIVNALYGQFRYEGPISLKFTSLP